MTTYYCNVSQGSGGDTDWTETNLRRAIQQVRERVADGYQDDEDGTVSVEKIERDGVAVNVPVYRCVNQGGRAVKVNV